MRVLLPGHHWYSCVDVASVLPIMTCLSKQLLYRSETWVYSRPLCENMGARLSGRQKSKQNDMGY